MFRTFLTVAAMSTVLAGAAVAESFDVQMLNSGDEGRMVFEPSFLSIMPGDTVRFVAVDRGHNAETVEGMIPEGAEAFSGRINEEIDAVFDVEGVYGIRCTPHFSMGMVMIVQVGDVSVAPDDFLEGRIPRNAKVRFEEQLDNL